MGFVPIRSRLVVLSVIGWGKASLLGIGIPLPVSMLLVFDNRIYDAHGASLSDLCRLDEVEGSVSFSIDVTVEGEEAKTIRTGT